MKWNFLIGIACFVLPLLGIHGRLVAQKAALLDEADRPVLFVRQHRCVVDAEHVIDRGEQILR